MQEIKQGQLISLMEEDEEDYEAYDIELEEMQKSSTSVWIKKGDLFYPSIDAQINNVLLPGVYTIHQGQEVFAKKAKISEDKLYNFSNSVSEKLLSEIELFWTKYEDFKKAEVVHKRGILLEGPPGTGKTSIINLICSQLIRKNGVVFKLRNARNFDSYLEFIKLFRQIEPNRNFITIIEDIDDYNVIKTDLLDLLDGKSQFNGHIVLATTNNSKDLEDTFLRPSRFDLRVLIGSPKESVKEEYLKNKGFSSEELVGIIPKINKFTFADLKELFISVKLLGYDLNSAIEKILNPISKKNYLNQNSGATNLGI
jgi:hypothetical protein